ncbi:MAG: carbonic anhydrase [Nitrososphaerales archaeon]
MAQKDLMGKHHAEACTLSCIDFRLVDATVSQLERGTTAPFDYTALPGASLYVVNNEVFPNWSSTYLQTVQVAVDLHHIKGLVMVQHEDCGAFRGFYNYLVDPKTGKIPYRTEKKLAIETMEKAAKLVQKLHPDLYFRGYWIKLDGSLQLVLSYPAKIEC